MMKSAVITTHSFSPGTSQALHHYMKRKQYDVIFIEHKLFGNALTWILDALDIFVKIITKPKTYDLYVGSNRLNASVGIILKLLKKVKKVVYFSPDWVENRLDNKILNYIYQKLDYFCVLYADVVWNSSAYMKIDPMMKERIKRGYPNELLQKQMQVPDGTDPYPIKSFSEINRHKIGFVGHIKEGMGLEMLIEGFKKLLNEVPDATLLIIGSGPILDQLKKMAQSLPIEFTGFMGNINQVYEKLSQCAFAVAPYEQGTISQYTDPGKVKVYFSVGLPVIISSVPQISSEIKQEKCGIVIENTVESLTVAMKHLIIDDHLLQTYRTNVLKMRKKYSWDSIFDKALNQL